MKLILHQLKYNLRQNWIWLAVLWLVFAFQAWLGRLPADPNVIEGLSVLVVSMQLLLAKLVVLKVIHGNPLVSDKAWWMTRPLHRRQVFGGQAAMLILGVVLPLLAAQGTYWALSGYGWRQWMLAELQLAALALLVISLLAAVASLTPNYTRFMLVAVLYAGGFIVWSLGVNLLHSQRMQMFDPGRVTSALVVGNAVLLGLALAAWFCQGLAGWRRASYALLGMGLLAFMPLQHLWRFNFYRAERIENHAVQVELLSEADAANPQLTNQVLWTHFKVSGLASNQLAMVSEMVGRFGESAQRGASIVYRTGNPNFAPDYVFDLWRRNEALWQFIKAHFPTETLWMSEFGALPQRTLPTEGASLRNGAIGRLQGLMSLEVFQVDRVADLPLRASGVTLADGERIAVARVDEFNGQLKVRVRETIPMQVLHPDGDYALSTRWQSRHLLVLHNPMTSEAYIFNPMQGGRTVSLLLNQERHGEIFWEIPLGNDSAALANWRQHGQLHVFRLKSAGHARREFNEENYVFQRERSVVSLRHRQAGTAGGMPSPPPENASDAEIQTYVDALLDGLPDQAWDGQGVAATTRKQLQALGPRVVPAIVRRLPKADPMELNLVRPVLQSEVRPEHLPVLQASLKESPAVAWLFLRKEWINEAQAALRPWVKQRKVVLPGEAVMLAAGSRDPNLANDLLWHFAQGNDLHGQMLMELKQMPRIEVRPAIAQAWKRMRLGYFQSDNLALIAAAEGLPTALPHVAARLPEQSKGDAYNNFRDKLRALTDYQGPPEEFESWLLRHAPKLKFDERECKYRLEE